MITVDSSILVGIIRRETDLLHLADLPFSEDIAITAPAFVEAQVWCAFEALHGPRLPELNIFRGPIFLQSRMAARGFRHGLAR